MSSPVHHPTKIASSSGGFSTFRGSGIRLSGRGFPGPLAVATEASLPLLLVMRPQIFRWNPHVNRSMQNRTGKVIHPLNPKYLSLVTDGITERSSLFVYLIEPLFALLQSENYALKYKTCCWRRPHIKPRSHEPSYRCKPQILIPKPCCRKTLGL